MTHMEFARGCQELLEDMCIGNSIVSCLIHQKCLFSRFVQHTIMRGIFFSKMVDAASIYRIGGFGLHGFFSL